MKELNDAASFGQAILNQFMAEGWGSLTKRDLELLMFILLEKDGALDRGASGYAIARELRMTQSKVAALRRDAYARWRPFVEESTQSVIKRVLLRALTLQQLESAVRHMPKQREGCIPLLIEHPDDRLEIENAIKECRGIPIHERNREVVLVHYETLVAMASAAGILDEEPKSLRRRLKERFGGRVELQKVLTKPIQDVTPEDLRDAINTGLAKAMTEGVLPMAAFLKTIIPLLR